MPYNYYIFFILFFCLSPANRLISLSYLGKRLLTFPDTEPILQALNNLGEKQISTWERSILNGRTDFAV